MTDSLVMIVGLLADEAPRDTGPDFGKASPFGLLIVVLMVQGCAALRPAWWCCIASWNA